ncbi:hypothetical protein CTI14_48825, partial [Methylobacterium radiotolerans]
PAPILNQGDMMTAHPAFQAGERHFGHAGQVGEADPAVLRGAREVSPSCMAGRSSRAVRGR